MEHPVYDGPYARAAALVHTLGRCHWLEASNLTVACAVDVMYLEASNIPTREQLTALAGKAGDALLPGVSLPADGEPSMSAQAGSVAPSAGGPRRLGCPDNRCDRRE